MLPLPHGKDFAFTIIDDTDDAFLDQIKSIYDVLYGNGIITTKTVWVYPPRDTDRSKGDSLMNEQYLSFVRELIIKNYEIALHNVGSGNYKRSEIEKGIQEFKNLLGFYPVTHINHSYNKDNIYSGSKRFSFPLNYLVKLLYSKYSYFEGDNPQSDYFWGDYHKNIIKYNRNYEIDNINTYKINPYLPYKERRFEKYSNYWFSASFAPNQWMFNHLVNKKNIDRLERERGISIIFTHLGYFAPGNKIDKGFIESMEYLGKKTNGWFVPIRELLDYILSFRLEEGKNDYLPYINKMLIQLHHLKTRIKYRYIKKMDDFHFKRSSIYKSN